MTPGSISPTVIGDRVAWIRRMRAGIRTLPLETESGFLSDPRTGPAAESYLRRAVESLLDLGRHVLAKGFARAVSEYKMIATALQEEGVLTADEAAVLRQLAGYRNRMVHFYHAIGDEELRLICRDGLGDVELIVDRIVAWATAHSVGG